MEEQNITSQTWVLFKWIQKLPEIVSNKTLVYSVNTSMRSAKHNSKRQNQVWPTLNSRSVVNGFQREINHAWRPKNNEQNTVELYAQLVGLSSKYTKLIYFRHLINQNSTAIIHSSEWPKYALLETMWMRTISTVFIMHCSVSSYLPTWVMRAHHFGFFEVIL